MTTATAHLPQHWQFKKEVSFGNIITTVMLLVAGFIYVSDLDKKIMLNTQSNIYIKEQRKEDTVRLEKSMNNMNKKLDTLITKLFTK